MPNKNEKHICNAKVFKTLNYAVHFLDHEIVKNIRIDIFVFLFSRACNSFTFANNFSF